MSKLYTEKSIESLNPRAFTRLRPQVYCGSTEYSTQLLVEIISNSIDEYRLGHGSKIKVVIDNEHGIFTVFDNGQGFIPNSFREDGKTILEAAFSVLNTSGKFREDGTYEGTSLGSFGIGSKLVTFLSNWTKVKTYRDGLFEEITFEEGLFKERKVGEAPTKTSHGTVVSWRVSKEFFVNVGVEKEKVKNLFKTLVCLCSGLTIELTYNGKEEVFFSEHGIDDLLDDITNNKEIINNRFKMNYSYGKEKIDLSMTYSSNYASKIVAYVNTGLTDTGPHITKIKTALTKEFNKFLRDKKWLKQKEENLTGDDIQEGLCLVFNVTAPNVAYDAQVKSRVTQIEMSHLIPAFVESLKVWMEENERDIKIIADKAINARKARNAAKKAREIARKPKAKGLKAKMAISDKFIDCVSKDPSKRNLLLVEGLSAGGSTLEARNVETDCIYMLRGKIISPLKQSLEKILANQEISDIIKIIGAGFGNEFDADKMQFDKIVITADFDSDGQAIELLLTTFFFTYMRPLVEQGKLYRAVTPLYIINTKKEKHYCYTEEELKNWKEIHNESYELTHCKG